MLFNSLNNFNSLLTTYILDKASNYKLVNSPPSKNILSVKFRLGNDTD